MVPIECTITCESDLYKVVRIGSTECEQVCPVYAPGALVRGTIVLSAGQQSVQLKRVRMTHRVVACVHFEESSATGMSGEEGHILEEYPVELPLESTKSYTLNGLIQIPFELPASAVVAVENCGTDALQIVHELDFRCNDGYLSTGCSAQQHLCVQVVGPAPPTELPKGKPRPWLTVGDFGGVCKVELASDEVALGGVVRGKLTLRDMPPLRAARLQLVQVVGTECKEAGRQIVRDAAVWESEGEHGAAGGAEGVEVEVEIEASATDPILADLYPSLPGRPPPPPPRPRPPSPPSAPLPGSRLRTRHLRGRHPVPRSRRPRRERNAHRPHLARAEAPRRRREWPVRLELAATHPPPDKAARRQGRHRRRETERARARVGRVSARSRPRPRPRHPAAPLCPRHRRLVAL